MKENIFIAAALLFLFVLFVLGILFSARQLAEAREPCYRPPTGEFIRNTCTRVPTIEKPYCPMP
jgi:hypothetical protein